METRTYVRVATLISAAGVAFSGYLSITRMSIGVCAFSEPCPFFLGHPACYTGFALFSIALLISTIALVGKATSSWPAIANAALGAVGVLFAGRLTMDELATHASYRLGLPTCAYGFVFFVALLLLSLSAWVSHWHARPRERSAS